MIKRAKKKAISIVITLCLLLTLMPQFAITASADQIIWGGTKDTSWGTDYDTQSAFTITTGEQLAQFAEMVNGGSDFSEKTVTLGADIVLNDVTNASSWNDSTTGLNAWSPIGLQTKPFKGTFDGDGHTVSGIYISNDATEYQGLFGYIDQGSVVKNTGVIDSYIRGRSNVGGIAGMNNKGTIKRCYNTGNISSKDGLVGGIAGYNFNYLTGSLEECFNTGRISGDTGSIQTGGITGQNQNAKLKNCFNIGDVYGDRQVGGVVGYYFSAASSVLENCYNAGRVSGNSSIGGIVGFKTDPIITKCYYDSDTSGVTTGLGGYFLDNDHQNEPGVDAAGITEGKTTAEMKTDTAFDSWDTSSIWLFESGKYPRFQGMFDPFTAPTVTGVTSSGTDAAISSSIELTFSVAMDTSTDGIVSLDNNVGALPAGSWSSGDTVYTVSYDNLDYLTTYTVSISGFKDTNGNMISADTSHTFTTIADTSWYTGHESDTSYIINNAAQLTGFSQLVNAGTDFSGKTVTLGADIVLNDVTNASGWDDSTAGLRAWIPIGSEANRFSGTFDGGNHIISGIYINNSTADHQGLFGYVLQGTVKNVSVNNSYIHGGRYVGGVVGYCIMGTVNNCFNSGKVKGSNSEAGGVAGCIKDSSMDSCENSGEVNGTGSVGGIAGKIDGSGTMKNCSNSGNVTGTGFYVGGIVGVNYKNVELCFNTGNVSGTSYVGGISGYSSGGTVEKCYNQGNITGSSENIAGVIGLNEDNTVQNCFNSGSVSATNGSYVGGVAGRNFSSGPDSLVKYCYNAGTLSLGGGSSNYGGVVGQNNGTVTGCYYDKERCSEGGINNSDVVGQAEGLLTANLQTATSFENWDTTVWSFEAGQYPEIIVAPPTFIVTFDAKGGSSIEDRTNISSDSVITAPTAPTKSGYTFGGWYTDAAYTTAWNFAVDKVTANRTLFAKWTEAPANNSGSSSGSSSAPKSEGAEVIVNGQSQTAGVAKNSTNVAGQTMTTVSVDTDKLQAILKQKDNGASVVIPVKGGADVAQGLLTGAMIKDIEKKEATLEIQTENSTYTLPASEINIDSISQKLGSNVDLSNIGVSIQIAKASEAETKIVENAAAEGGFAVQVAPIDFTISCTYGNKTVEVTNFNSYVQRMVAIPQSVDASKITTAIVVDKNGKTRHIPTYIKRINGSDYAVINSLTNSTYTLVWHPIEFSDVTADWAKNAVNDLGSRMIVTGDSDSIYDPNRSITRAEFAAIMVRALGLAPSNGATDFDDVSSSRWYAAYVKTAYEYGIIQGYDANAFGPEDSITREQVMTIIARTMKLTGLSTDVTEEILSQYADKAEVSSYALDGVKECVQTGVVTGRNNTSLAPAKSITRAEVAVIVQRLLQKSDLID